MRRLLALAASAVLTLAPTTASAATAASNPIRWEWVFLNEQYEEVGRYIGYCDGYGVMIGEWTYRQVTYEYVCPED